MTSAVKYDAILLAGFGGPEGPDDIMPFLRNVTRGRGIPDARLEEVAAHYRHFGGVSPINEQNRQLKAAIEVELAERDIALPVLWGNRNWAPYLPEVLTEADQRGFTRLLGVATSAYSSYSSCRQYREDFATALAVTGLTEKIHIDKVRQYFDHPGFVMPFIEAVRGGYQELADRGVGTDRIVVLFSTHSIPIDDANRSGPRDTDFGPGAAYAAQHRAVAKVVMDAQDEPGAWELVYQSRSGPPSMPWLEPDINDVIGALDTETVDAVIIVPLGFVSDHLEVIWDLDTEAMQAARERGIEAIRVGTPGTHHAFIAGLVDLIEERLNGTPEKDRPAMTELGPWYDVCRPGCCENIRAGFKPAVAGVAP